VDLLAHLRGFGVGRVQRCQDAASAYGKCLGETVDLLLCVESRGVEDSDLLLRRLPTLPRIPAVALAGFAPALTHLEHLCLQNAICYLGYLGQPVDADRLRRVVELAQQRSRRLVA
jgi:hypothetical protein